MQFYSTNNKNNIVDLETAIFDSLPKDKGLYMPMEIPVLDHDFIKSLKTYSFQEIAFQVSKRIIGSSIPSDALRQIIDRAVNFPAPLIALDDHTNSLELWHGPSLAFKDFGARFMAELMSYFNVSNASQRTILVATSGDTGGAVAQGFYNVPGTEVIILYPSGKVSDLQEKQLTTLGANIEALEIHGTFDDCQALVKKAFVDVDLSDQYNLSSANSINIARLIPQTFYYFEAYRQLEDWSKPTIFSIPSGNFGNLTAGLIAKRMGLPIDKFLAATNLNNIVPSYLDSGIYQPKPSVQTLSNAMDVGDPSNFVRMKTLYGGDIEAMRNDISGYFFDDAETVSAIKEIKQKYGYTAEPHGAIAYLALKEYQIEHPDTNGIFLETAHPAKFLDVMDSSNISVDIPERLLKLKDKTKKATSLGTSYEEFNTWMKDRN